MVLLLPIDQLLWTGRNAAFADGLVRSYAPDLWITGDASPRAKAGLAQAGFALTQHCGKQLPLLD